MITFKINGIDISNDVILSSFNYMQRIDEVFGTGSFQFESKTIDYNIPPYSILQINNNYYCCSSEATYHYGRGTWFHNVSVIEATSLLSRFLVGSKAFSVTGTNTYDYQKINILIELIEQKYGVNINLTRTPEYHFLKRIEYVFTAGTTLFDALNEISKQYNTRFYVESANEKNITISYTRLEDLPNLSINNSNVLSVTKTQNAETYCKYLESEATNVIDTNQLTIANNLFPKAREVKLTEDTFVIETPTKIAKLQKFEMIKVDYNVMNTQIQFKDSIWLSQQGQIVEKNFAYWTQQYTYLNDFYENVYSKYYPDKYWFYSQIWVGQEHILYPKKTDGMNAGELGYAQIPINFTSHILSKEQYDLLENKDKPNYAYYTYGTNTIEGFNVAYKDDFWNSLLGESVTPFLLGKINTNYVDKSGVGYKVNDNAYISIFEVKSQFATEDVFSNFYRVSYYPIANPYVISEKQDAPSNEETYRPYAVSYNKSSNFIDFDKLTNSMETENKSLGKPEIVIEYDTTEFGSFKAIIYKLMFDNQTWFTISSSIQITNAGQLITTFNLVSDFNKVADVISLNSQYNTLKNPLDNIIERPILIKTNEQFEIKNGETWIVLRFYDSKNNLLASKSTYINLLSPTILANDNNVYLYCEMKDNYSISTNITDVSSKVYKLDDVKYVDTNNECFKVKVKLLNIKGFTYDSTKKMPVVDTATLNGAIELIDEQEIILYKDAREKLTFTIQANKCIIK